jgi:hypothetical protein
MRCGLTIDTQSVDIVRRYKVADPALQAGNDVGMLRVDVHERELVVAEPALLHARHVAVVDPALVVEVVGLRPE